MEILIKTLKDIGEHFFDTVKLLFSHCINILVLFVFGIVFHFISLWILVPIVIILAVIIFASTLQDELRNIDDED